MAQTEKLKVYIRIEKGHTVCMCLKSHKLCSRYCETDEVERDKYRQWEKTMTRDKYGK